MRISYKLMLQNVKSKSQFMSLLCTILENRNRSSDLSQTDILLKLPKYIKHTKYSNQIGAIQSRFSYVNYP